VEGFALCGLAYPTSPDAPDAAGAESVPGPDEPATAAAADVQASAISPPASVDESADTVPIVPSDEAPSVVPVAEEPAGADPASAAGPSDIGTQAEPNTPQASDSAMPKTILTIDDSRTMRDMLKMALGGAGFTVLQAVDGQDGLNVLARQPVDLIITDINMPKLDGYGVIRAVRKDPTYNDTPILVLSTEGEQESKDIAKDAGATGWIVKPFDPDGLIEIVNTVCG
jgi:two-component system, chemotaxis family, chemotaxis protein CheY